jgi:hypothetical protein
LTAELLERKGRILAVFSPFETGDTENPLLFGEKGQKGGCAISARAVFYQFSFKNSKKRHPPPVSLLKTNRGGSQNFLAFGTNF